MEKHWAEGYRRAAEYLESLDERQWQQNYVSPDDFRIGAWLRARQRAFKRGGMKPERDAVLHTAGGQTHV